MGKMGILKTVKRSFCVRSLVLTVSLAAVSVQTGCRGTYAGSEDTAPESVAESDPLVEEMRDLIRSKQFIIHAGGEITNSSGKVKTVTDSREAIENYLENGESPFLEIDLSMTSDGAPVCIHSWKRCRLNGVALEEAPTLEEFQKSKVSVEFTPMTGDDLAGIMQDHPDIYVVTDVKDGYNETCMTYFAETYPDLRNRFIVQIYHADEYDGIASLGYPYILFTLYETESEEHHVSVLREFMKDHPLVAITFRAKYLKSKPWRRWLKKLNQDPGIPMLVHTLDDEDKIEEAFAYGVTGIYTNKLSPGGLPDAS